MPDKKAVRIAAILLVALACTPAAWMAWYEIQVARAAPDPTELLGELQRKFPREHISRWEADEFLREAVMRGLGSAETDWLRVAEELAPHVSGHSGEDFYGALSRALDVHPRAVLAIRTLELDLLCAAFDDHALVAQDLPALYRNRIASLGRIDDPDLRPLAARCAGIAQAALASSP